MKKYDIVTYSKLAEGANFYLNESFNYIDESLINDFAAIIFSKELELIDPTEHDREIIGKINLPINPVELLQTELPDVLSKETNDSISNAITKAEHISRIKTHKFDLNHSISSIEILGHLNNFSFFLEILINRHLLFLAQSNLLDSLSYARISFAKVMERLVFIFKDELKSNKIQLNEISNLFSLRNKTVHYTPENASVLSPRISELIQIWVQSKKLIEKFENIEMFKEEKFSIVLTERINEFKIKWT